MRSYSSQERIDQSLWETILGDDIPDLPDPFFKEQIASRARSPEARRFAEYHCMFEKNLSRGSQTAQEALGFSISEEEDWKFFQYLGTRFSINVLGKKLCVTADRSIALVPPLSEKRNVFIYVEGSYMPLLLRTNGEEATTAQLIRSCYVHRVKNTYSGTRWDQWTLV